jgi:preprotein translocase subunit SecA
MNKQRESIYALRREILEGKIHFEEDQIADTREYLMYLAEDLLDATVETYAPAEGHIEDWDLEALKREIARVFAINPATLDFSGQTADEIRESLWEKIRGEYEAKEHMVSREILQRVARDVMLQIVDQQWKDHLYSLDHLKEGIGLRGYGQRDPLVEYKKESFDLFQAMKARIDDEIVRYMWWLRPVINEAGEQAPQPARQRPRAPLTLSGPSEAAPPAFGGRAAAAPAPAPAPAGGQAKQPPRVGGDDAIKTVRRDEPKVGRNDPCPCGSGKKYKKCHGAGT